jgi:hypothetical protein
MVLVRETTDNRASAGHDAGVTDAKAALKQARALHMPEDRPIYFAVDYDAPGPDVRAYFEGIGTVLPLERIGVYGGLRSVTYLHKNKKVHWVWQTYAWSGGKWYGTTHIRQYNNGISVGGVDCDADRAWLPDYGQWMPNKSPVTPAPPTPTPGKGKEVQSGELKNGKNAHTMISLPYGSGTNIAFATDNGYQKLPGASLRVAIHDKAGWHVSNIVVDSDKVVQYVVHFPDPKTTGAVGIHRLDNGDVDTAWEIS